MNAKWWISESRWIRDKINELSILAIFHKLAEDPFLSYEVITVLWIVRKEYESLLTKISKRNVIFIFTTG